MEPDGELRRRLEEAEQTLEAIRRGDVDALVVTGPQGEQIYSVAGAEHVYRVIVETMNEAALMVDPDGTILFCNQRFCDLVKTPIQEAMGHKVTTFAAQPQQPPLLALLTDAQAGPVQRRLTLRATDGTSVPVQLSASPLRVNGGTSLCLVATDLTELEAELIEHKRMEEALRESEARFRSVQESSPDGFVMFRSLRDDAGRIIDFVWTYMNDPAGCAAGVPHGGLLGKRLLEVYPGNRDEGLFDAYVRVVETGEPLVREVQSARDGLAAYARLMAIKVDDGIAVSFLDLSERKRAEEAAIRIQRTFIELVERAPFGIYIVDSQFRIAHMNVGSQNGAFRNVRPVIGRDFSEAMRILWPEPVAAGIIAVFRHTLETGEPYYSPRFTNPRHDVETVESYEWELHRMTLPDGQYGVICYYFDSTKLREAEAATQRSESLLRTVIETTADGIYAKDAQSRLVLVNPASLKIVGKPADQVLGRDDREFYDDPAVGAAILENDRQVMASGTVQAFEETLLTPQGYRFFLDKKAPWRDDNGNVIGIIGVSHDITEQKRAVEALRDRELRLRLAQEHGHIGVWDWYPDTGEENFSAEMSRIYGLKPGTIRTYQDWLSRVHPEDIKRMEAQRDAALANHEPFDLEFRVFHSSGQVRWIAGRGAAEYDETGQITRVLGINIDITAIKKAEEVLRELNTTLEVKVAQRTAQLEYRARQLQKLTLELSQAEERERRRVAVLLHEGLQQQIAGARFHLNTVRNRASDDSQRAEVDRVNEMLREAIEESRRLSHDLSPAVLHMNDLAEALRWLANRVREQRGLIAHVDVSGDMTLQSEALTMFLFRATQEMLFNVVKHARVNDAAIRVRRIGRYVCLSVSDQGRGFDPQELKETSGIGLFGIRERVELLGGRMKIKSTKGKGSRFRIVVPDGLKAKGETMMAQDVSNLRAASSAVSAPSSGGAVRVLLADDHDIVREGLAALLKEAPGIELVGEAPDGREAINMAIALHPDVVLMDVSMPLLSGDQATRQIKTYLPETRVIALSMYDEADKKEKMFQAGAEGYILKTISADELIAAIRDKE
jgi:PAS domain S-box-containing protein